jgi:glycosyltransferase involved in cell wall biosynthesis
MKFCFFGDFSGALKGVTPGGGELQVALLAKALALKGHEVVIIAPGSQENFITAEGVKLISVPNWNKGLKGVRLFLYRIPRLKKMLIEQNADYYYVRMRTYLHLLPFWASKKVKAKFIIAAACDLDTLSHSIKFKYEYKPKFNLFRFLTVDLPADLVFDYLLKKADYVILQHSGQRINLGSAKGKIIIFPNIFDFSNITPPKNPVKDYFIHPGALSILKGSENLYTLITSLHRNIPIVIVGQPTDKKSKKLYKQLQKVENVVLKGRLNHKETIQLIANAKALINTSNFEGFPNIFLEAWASGVPVISLNVNPGEVFNKHNLGTYCEGDLNKMKKSIELFKNDSFQKEKLISYVVDFHDFRMAADRFLNIINNSEKN